MPGSRRNFIRQMSAFTAGGIAFPLFASAEFDSFRDKLSSFKHADFTEAALDEDFWFYIQQAYISSPNFVNLNNGGVCPQPRVVQESFAHYNRLANEAPAYYMFHDFVQKRVAVREKLAALAGCSSDEINICRNTTEALETVLFGLDFKKGDEVITTNQDYPTVMAGLEQRSRRDGIKIVKISLPVPAEDKQEVVNRFEKAITPKTKMIVVSHIVFMTGQILPVREICDMAHRHGLEVMVDGAHSFAHLNFKISDLNCDYFGTSLHKWLSAPFGCGMLYIKKEKISKVWSLFGSPEDQQDKMSKFDHLGTRSFPAELAISDAIDFHNGIGIKRKEARLRYLKNYWANAVSDSKKVIFNTSLKEEFSCALCNFDIDGKDPNEVYQILFKDHKLFTTTIFHDEFRGIRITPHVYTSIDNLDRLINAIKKIVA